MRAYELIMSCERKQNPRYSQLYEHWSNSKDYAKAQRGNKDVLPAQISRVTTR
jgi:hypothetical protein